MNRIKGRMRKYIKDPGIYKIYIRELELLVISTNTEAKNGAIFIR